MLMYVAFRFYTLKNMENFNQPPLRGKGIILLGDRDLGGMYVNYAKRRLSELRYHMSMLDMSMMTRTYRPLESGQSIDNKVGRNFVEVTVSSHFGTDHIRIYALKEKGVTCETEFTFAIDGNTVTFTPGDNPCFAGNFWEFGDNQYQFAAAATEITHFYERPGSFTATLHNYKVDFAGFFGTITANNTLLSDKGAIFSLVSNADCYSTFSALTFGGIARDFSFYNARFNANIWRYVHARSSFDIPLSNVALDSNAVNALNSNKAWLYMSGGDFQSYFSYDDDGASKPVAHAYSGTNAGLVPFESRQTVQSTISLLDPSASLVDSQVGMWDQSTPGVDPPNILPDPAGMAIQPSGSRFSGWEGRRILTSNPMKLQLTAFSEKKSLSKAVTIT